MEFKVDKFTVKLHRANEISHDEDVNRFAKYVSIICEVSKRQQKGKIYVK